MRSPTLAGAMNCVTTQIALRWLAVSIAITVAAAPVPP
jgi:hypothetical protein